jgi:hypothetical protein
MGVENVQASPGFFSRETPQVNDEVS